VLAVQEPADDLVAQLAAAIAATNDVVLPTIRQVDALLRQEEADNGAPVEVGDAMQVLDGLGTSCDPQVWQTAVANSNGGKFVLGSADVIDRLTVLIARYVEAWDALGTDALKGASYAGIKELANLRMEIVQTIAESGEPLLMACCCPGTPFHDYIKSLASQTCNSRDVQNFSGWWAKRARTIWPPSAVDDAAGVVPHPAALPNVLCG
jgi:hypothetical protein